MNVLETKKAPGAIGPYSQGYEVNGFVFTSGQIAIDPATGSIDAQTVEEQTHQALRNLQAVLEAAGTGTDKVIKTTCFLKHMSDFAAFNAVYAQYFLNKPARSCVEVGALPKDALVEVEAVAEL